MGLKENIRKSFWNIKRDMTEIKDQIRRLSERLEKLEVSLEASLQKQQQTNAMEEPVHEHTAELVQIREPKKIKKRNAGEKAK